MDNKTTKSLQLGRNIAKARKDKGISQNQLANLVNVSREHIAKIETGKRCVSIKLLFEICEKIGIPEKDLFEFY